MIHYSCKHLTHEQLINHGSRTTAVSVTEPRGLVYLQTRGVKYRFCHERHRYFEWSTTRTQSSSSMDTSM